MDQNLRPYVKSNTKLDLQKNPLNETGLLSTQNIRKNMGKKIFTILAENFCVSKHVIYMSLLSSANYLLITRQITSDHHLEDSIS